MKYVRTILISLLLVIHQLIYAQMKDQPNQFLDLKKDSLVQIAKNHLAPIIENKGGAIEHIDFSMYRAVVMANSHLIWVSFNIPIVYLPVKTSYYVNMSVEVKSGTVHIQEVSNPKNTKQSPVFYTLTTKSNEVIDFIVNALNLHESSSINPATFNDGMIITDEENHYRVIIQSDYFYSDYKIEKDSGIILSQAHEDLIPQPEGDEEKLIEIIE